MTSILIIGSDSFIASKFIQKFDSRYTIKSVCLKETSFKNEIKVNNYFDIDLDYFKDVDVVINFAAIVHKPKIKDADLYDRINYQLPVDISKKCIKSKVKHFIQLSSVSVYGETEEVSVNTEERPMTLYGISKLKADKHLLRLQPIDITVVRPPMVYGGGVSNGNLEKLIKLIAKGIPVPFKDIDNRRTFCNVWNLIDSIDVIIKERITGVVIPTDNKDISTHSLVSTIYKELGNRNKSIFIPSFFRDFIKFLKPKLYIKLFGNSIVKSNFDKSDFYPKYSIEEGVREIVNELKK
ncbi:MAG: NAD-dependent epimerase/dehydratase family protein [Marinifilaceae bacterium]|jgi:UDP-glucose 4-epimerase|nr:NAD-dependent epimerase/dehydratase family protein [Marinifilaceae bacterium]